MSRHKVPFLYFIVFAHILSSSSSKKYKVLANNYYEIDNEEQMPKRC
jgi:hypothetical protein